MFNGRIKITVCAAKELQLTSFMKRLNLGASGDASASASTLDPYVSIDADEVRRVTDSHTVAIFSQNTHAGALLK